MTEEKYKDYRLFITNALSNLCLMIGENGIFEETSSWLIKYGKYNIEAVEYLKTNKIFNEEEFEVLDKITDMMKYYEEYLGNIDDIGHLNYLSEADQILLGQLVERFLAIQSQS
jgi:hypothetical protein